MAKSTTKSGNKKKRSGAKGKSTGRKSIGKKRARTYRLDSRHAALLSGILLLLVAALAILSLVSPGQGRLTEFVHAGMKAGFGIGAYPVALFLLAIALYTLLWAVEHPPQLRVSMFVGLFVAFVSFQSLASLIMVLVDNNLNDVWEVARKSIGGGYSGALFSGALTAAVGQVGTAFTAVVLLLVSIPLILGVSRKSMSTAVGRAKDNSKRIGKDVSSRKIVVNRGRKRETTLAADGADEQVELPAVDQDLRIEKALRAKPATADTPSKGKKEGQGVAVPTFKSQSTSDMSWTLPDIADILDDHVEKEVGTAQIRQQVELIEHTLESFGAPATVVEINQGPTITQFGVEPSFVEKRGGKRTKVKVGKIAGLADDLALALAARSIRIQAPVPGKGYVGIEVPNADKAMVSLRTVMDSGAFHKIKSPLRLGLGQNVAGQPIAADLKAMPHLLIAGTTGSGKSVCVNTIVASLLLQNTPNDLKLVMIDPKRVELTGYNGIPHLVAPVVVDLDKVVGTLRWAIREMDNRYKLLAEAGTRNIREYNDQALAAGERKMPYVVIMIDELADLMMMAPEETERSITRLAQMARATGMHVIIATQRPSVDVVTGLIKANFPARIAFAVASGTDSRVILDTTGAERLLGQGDMLFQSSDSPAPIRMQGSFVGPHELKRLIDYWRGAVRSSALGEGDQESGATEPLDPASQAPLWEDMQEAVKGGKSDEDELLEESIAMVRKLDRASTSLLQRKFRIGYTRAARIMDTMEEMGVIGPPTGTSKARSVLPPSMTTRATSEEPGD